MLRACLRKSALPAVPKAHGRVTDKGFVLLQGSNVSRPQVHPMGPLPGLGGPGSRCSLQRDALGQPGR